MEHEDYGFSNESFDMDAEAFLGYEPEQQDTEFELGEASGEKDTGWEPVGEKKKRDPETKGTEKTSDSVRAVSAYAALRREHQAKACKYSKHLDKTVEQLLFSYHYESKDDEELHKWLKEEIFLKTFFLLPSVLKKSYYINVNIFNDAVQNMAVNVLVAIEKFRPEAGCTFVNYLGCYFLDAVTRTFKSTNIVAVPSARRRMMKEAMKAENDGLDTGKDPCEVVSLDANHFLPKTSVYDDSAFYRVSDDEYVGEQSFDEALHNKQLKEWLEEAMSRAAGVLTPDEHMVLTMHYGLFGTKQHPYKDIAKIRAAQGKGCAHSRLSQIHTKAVAKLREFFHEACIEEY